MNYLSEHKEIFRTVRTSWEKRRLVIGYSVYDGTPDYKVDSIVLALKLDEKVTDFTLVLSAERWEARLTEWPDQGPTGDIWYEIGNLVTLTGKNFLKTYLDDFRRILYFAGIEVSDLTGHEKLIWESTRCLYT